MLSVPLIAGRLARRVSQGLLSGIGFIVAAIGWLLPMRMSPLAAIAAIGAA